MTGRKGASSGTDALQCEQMLESGLVGVGSPSQSSVQLNQWKVSQRPSNPDRGVINALVGSGELAHSGLSLIVLRLRAGDSVSPLNDHLTHLKCLHLLLPTHLFSVSARSPVTCRLSPRPSCGTEDSVTTQ